MGGKHRIAKHIVGAMGKINGDYYEPFVGGANVVQWVSAKNRYASDVHAALISMWNALQDGWIPPVTVTKADYAAAKLLPDTDPRKAFIGYGCSFGGKYFAGYARHKKGVTDTESFCTMAYNSIKRKMSNMQDVKFSVSNHREITPVPGDTLYCDPPYINTRGYRGTNKFDHTEFWNVMTQHAKNGVRVFVSEYVAPDDWITCLEIPIIQTLRTAKGGCETRVEKLFAHRDSTL